MTVRGKLTNFKVNSISDFLPLQLNLDFFGLTKKQIRVLHSNFILQRKVGLRRISEKIQRKECADY